MQATRILPDLQCSLICEEVRQEANGNLFLIGVLNFIRVPQLPVVAGRICLFNRWTAGIGQFNETIRLIAPDQSTVLTKSEMKFEVAGTYYIEVLVDDVMKLRYPLPVVVAPAPNQKSPAAEKQG